MTAEAGRIVVPIEVQMAQLDARLREAEAKVAASTNRMNRRGGGGIMAGSTLTPRLLRGGIGGFGLMGAGALLENATERWTGQLSEMERVLRSSADGLTKFSSAMSAVPIFGSFFRAGNAIGDFGMGMLGRFARSEGWTNAESTFTSEDFKEWQLGLLRTITDLDAAAREQQAIIEADTDLERQEIKLKADHARALTEIDRLLKDAKARFIIEKLSTNNNLIEMLENTIAMMKSNEEKAIQSLRSTTDSKVGRDDFSTPFGMWRVLQQNGDFNTQAAPDPPKESTQKDVKKNTDETAKAVRDISRTLEGFEIVGFH